jgi:hypothetical protein
MTHLSPPSITRNRRFGKFSEAQAPSKPRAAVSLYVAHYNLCRVHEACLSFVIDAKAIVCDDNGLAVFDLIRGHGRNGRAFYARLICWK